MTPDPPNREPDPPADQFTLEEWIAATQSCCGTDPPDAPDELDDPATASDS